jgi:signal transduction histidine kinase
MPVLAQAAGPHAVIRTDLSENLWPCVADEAQLGSAILNLILNARDAMAEDGGVIRITTRNTSLDRPASTAVLEPGDYVRVTLTDTGTGMPPSVLRRATEPLYTTKDGGMGTGLGLSQAYGFARQAGGDLRIESTVGVGTSVHLLFRRAPAGAADAGPAHDRLRGGRSRRSPAGLRAGSP